MNFLKLPRCPYCGNRFTYSELWKIRKYGECSCNRCDQTFRIRYGGNIYFIVIALSILEIFMYISFGGIYGRLNAFTLILMVLPVLFIYLILPTAMTLRRINMRRPSNIQGRPERTRIYTPGMSKQQPMRNGQNRAQQRPPRPDMQQRRDPMMRKRPMEIDNIGRSNFRGNTNSPRGYEGYRNVAYKNERPERHNIHDRPVSVQYRERTAPPNMSGNRRPDGYSHGMRSENHNKYSSERRNTYRDKRASYGSSGFLSNAGKLLKKIWGKICYGVRTIFSSIRSYAILAAEYAKKGAIWTAGKLRVGAAWTFNKIKSSSSSSKESYYHRNPHYDGPRQSSNHSNTKRSSQKTDDYEEYEDYEDYEDYDDTESDDYDDYDEFY